jgi:hypothetical protein
MRKSGSGVEGLASIVVTCHPPGKAPCISISALCCLLRCDGDW